MNKQQYAILGIFVFSFLMLISLSSVSAVAISHNIVTANFSEYNTATPSIIVNVTGNCTGYLANLSMGGVKVATGVAVANNTNTNVTATTSSTAGVAYYTNVSFYNATCDTIENTTGYSVFEVNARPTISTVSKSTASSLLLGNTLTWTTTWADENSSGTDSVKVYVCKTDAFTASGCTGGQWANSSFETDNSTTASYTIIANDTGGQKNYYVYTIDNFNYIVSSSTAGTFTVSRPAEEEENGQTTTTTTTTNVETNQGISGWWIVGIIVGLVIFFVLLTKEK